MHLHLCKFHKKILYIICSSNTYHKIIPIAVVQQSIQYCMLHGQSDPTIPAQMGGGGVGGGDRPPSFTLSMYLTEHTECHAFCPVVRIGSPHPLARKRVLPLPPPLVPRRETHSLAAEELGDPIPTKGQTLWYSMYTIIPLGSAPSIRVTQPPPPSSQQDQQAGGYKDMSSILAGQQRRRV